LPLLFYPKFHGVNTVLRRIFESKMDQVTRGLRKLHNEELRDSTLRQVEEDEMGGTCRMNEGEMERV
jgi:hypothetical protein